MNMFPYLVKFRIRVGELEFLALSVKYCSSDAKAEREATKSARSYYDAEGDEQDDGSFDHRGGSVNVDVIAVRRLTQDQKLVLDEIRCIG